MTNAHGIARDQLRAFIERIERLEEEKKTIADDIKDVYAEAKGMGFIPAMMKKVIALRKKDEMERMEEEAILDTYLHALGMIAQPDLFEEPHHPETGEIIDPKLAQTIVTGMQTETGRKALIAAVDIMIAREEAEEETHQRPSINDKPCSKAVLQDKPSPAGIGSESLAGREGRHEGEAASADLPTNSQSDDDAFAEVKGSARLANADGVEPSSSVQIDPAEDRSEGQSLGGELNAVGANTGGSHVDGSVERASGRQQDTHTLNNRLDGVPVQSVKKPLRPLCRNPGDNCGGYGSTHCASCLRASKQAEVAA
ncbi:DUF2312 domain-containing protein [Rhizobium bangladeshense]|nr:DUF2312 domain-containing protein [Rhizobium bangladeshense]